jgi:hypothetical protein
METDTNQIQEGRERPDELGRLRCGSAEYKVQPCESDGDRSCPAVAWCQPSTIRKEPPVPHVADAAGQRLIDHPRDRVSRLANVLVAALIIAGEFAAALLGIRRFGL